MYILKQKTLRSTRRLVKMRFKNILTCKQNIFLTQRQV